MYVQEVKVQGQRKYLLIGSEGIPIQCQQLNRL